MVLGIRSKSRKNVVIQLDYLIHIQEIKPWPLSQKSEQSIVFLQWENGDQPPGSFTSEVREGTIDFSESFKLPVTLIREASKKGTAHESYQKNILEFFLYEPRKDKPTKGQLLGTAMINLADYGVIRDTVSVTVPMNCKKSSKNSGQPVLYINIQAFGNEGIDSVSEATGEEAEIAAFTDDEVDDDGSSHSSRTTTSSIIHGAKIEPETSRHSVEKIFQERSIAPKAQPAKGSSPPAKTSNLPKESSPPFSSMGYSSNLRNPTNDSAAVPYVPPEKSIPILKKSVTHGAVRSSSSTYGYQNNQQKPISKNPVESSDQVPEYIQESTRVDAISSVASSSKYIHMGMGENYTGSQFTQEDDFGKVLRRSENGQEEEARLFESLRGPSRDTWNKDRRENGQKNNLVKKEYSFDAEACRLSPDASVNDTSSYSSIDIGIPRGIVKNYKLKHAKSVQITSDTSKNNGMLNNTEVVKNSRRTEVTNDIRDGAITKATSVEKGKTNRSSDSKGEMQSQIEMLKEELREAAAAEVGLYSVVAEHGSSVNKIHAPARRLSRFYFHVCTSGSKTKKANAARTAISGFIIVSKACGNDVPRLTFWLSNSIMLRAIVGQTIGKHHGSGGLAVNNKSGGKFSVEKFDSLDEPQKFMVALEKFESWIFSRIVESVWWQTMTPLMQPAAAKASGSKKASGRKSGFGDNEQGKFSIELWKKAFKDASERLCPSRACGHECGCLPVMSRLVMEQLVSRLDVAMFNAILRENGEEMPTDPVSDPISDSKVLPIAAGRSSFGAGAQLKNAIGSWSRCLTDIFDIDDGPGDKDRVVDEEKPVSQTPPFKPFRLLNALSDLMMIPFEMLADKTTRKEVCPSLSATLIKMILHNFVPDEFCPTPIPEAVFEALDSEADSEVDKEPVTTFPFSANPTIYSPPSAASLTSIIGDLGSQTLQRSGSSVLKKSYTSDDELDELDSPISSIIKDSFVEKRKGERKVVRYQLLHEVWKDSE